MCGLGYMQEVNVATFWSYNKTVENPFDRPQGSKGPDLLGTKTLILSLGHYVSSPIFRCEVT